MSDIQGNDMVWQEAFISDQVIEAVVAGLAEQGTEVSVCNVLLVLNMAAPIMAAAAVNVASASLNAMFCCNKSVADHYHLSCENCQVLPDYEDDDEWIEAAVAELNDDLDGMTE